MTAIYKSKIPIKVTLKIIMSTPNIFGVWLNKILKRIKNDGSIIKRREDKR